ncbi:MAG: DUF4249 domain-containing protein [Bacteroidota bacterium]|nr:DUF4249 domain-containing protein [Bacteroidota bacterium]
MKSIRIIFILFFFIDGCIDPLPVRILKQEPKLVVDGSITNEPGPYQVRLSFSTDLAQSVEKRLPATNASVWIIDDAGESEMLTEVAAGVYETNAGGMRGEIGRAYNIRIILSSEKEYYSLPQKMAPSGTIENIYTEFERNALNGDEPARPQDAVNVFIDSHGSGDEASFFRWRWTAVYHGRTYPELRTKGLPGGATIPDPPACSGWIYDRGELLRVGDCTCCSCWPYEYNSVAILSDPRFTSDNFFRKVQVAQIPVVPMRFHDKYYLELEQISLSEDAFKFWALVKAQHESAGSLFQPSAVKVTGNIRALDSDERALGVFEVSAITRRSFFVTQDVLPDPLPPIEQIAEDCTLVYTNGTNQKPTFW